MAFVSITRLRLRSVLFLPQFLLATTRSRRQLLRSPGFLEGRLTLERPLAFWTMTVWDTLDSMRHFRNTPPHQVAMRRLPRWCDEASYVHWEQSEAVVPTIDIAHARLRDEGHASKVTHPTPAHASGRTTSERKPADAPPFHPA